MSTLEDNLMEVRRRLAAACAKSRRDEHSVTLVAVSKGHPASVIRTAYNAGQRHFGENYAQELRDKAEECKDLDGLVWHFLGPLQSNKVKYVARVASWIHSVDRPELGQLFSEKRAPNTAPLKVLLEVNVGQERQKHGITDVDVPVLVKALGQYSSLKLVGLMCIPPAEATHEETRGYFSHLNALAQTHHLQELSMGMSHDFELAVECGATLVRVGTSIFGPRVYAPA